MVSIPRPPRPSWYDAEDAPDRREIDTCIHCGLCLTACPTYRELKIEPDSPRGRLYLMRGLDEGRIAPSDPLLHHLDLCLDCRACETVCPAGVPYGRLLEAARGQLRRRATAPGPLRALGEWALAALMPHRERLHLAADLLRLGQRGPIAALLRTRAGRRLLPPFASRGLELTPPIPPRRSRAVKRVADDLPPGARLEERGDALWFHPAEPARQQVALFSSCVMDVLFPGVARAAVRLLVLGGCAVRVPREQTCCGALQAHAGLRDLAKRLARRNVRAFGGAADPVVATSAGCGAALRECGHLLGGDGSAGAAAAASFASRVRDVSEVLAGLPLPEPRRLSAAALAAAGQGGEATGGLGVAEPADTEPASPLRPPGRRAAVRAPGRGSREAERPRAADHPLRVAYHDPCHLAHAQRVRLEPRALLARLPGVETVELPNSDWCCGSAGVYNLTHPAMAEAQLARKLEAIERVAPDLVIASNPGCLLHMARGARARGNPARIVHLVELLDLAYPPGHGHA